MTVVRDTVYAVAGWTDIPGHYLDTVESYTEGAGWKIEPEMRLPSAITNHCSVSLKDKELIVIGGHNGEAITSEVLSFDVENLAGGWTALPNINTRREWHACDTGYYEGQLGIFVTGGKAYNLSLIHI